MQVETHISDADLAGAFRSYVQRRLHFALARFGGRVGPVTVRVGNAGRSQGHCQIAAEVLPFGRVTVAENDPDLFVAVDRATGRIGRLFGRELERGRDARVGHESIRTVA